MSNPIYAGIAFAKLASGASPDCNFAGTGCSAGNCCVIIYQVCVPQ
jgi:hypothetical protein